MNWYQDIRFNPLATRVPHEYLIWLCSKKFVNHPPDCWWLVPFWLIFSLTYLSAWLEIITSSSMINCVLGTPYLLLIFNVKSDVVLQSTIPIIVFKWINIHKLQGISIGLGKYWGAAVVTIPAKHINTRLGTELEGFPGHPKEIIAYTRWLRQWYHFLVIKGNWTE